MKLLLLASALLYSSVGFSYTLKADCGELLKVKDSTISNFMFPLRVAALKVKLKAVATFTSSRKDQIISTVEQRSTHEKYVYTTESRRLEHLKLLSEVLDESDASGEPAYICIGDFANGIKNHGVVSVSSVSKEDAFNQLLKENTK